jgi:uncharacterized protein (TIGR03437 family)
MTNTMAKYTGAGVLGVLLACAASPAFGQNITSFRQYNVSPSFNGRDAVAADRNGGLYTSIGNDLRKYDSGGDELWTRQIEIGAREGGVTGLAVNAGGVFVAGGTLGVLPGQTHIGKTDAFVRRYDPSGRELWTRQFGTAESEIVHVIAADGNGVYVAGVVFGGSSTQHFVSKFDDSGNQLWTRHFNAGQTTLVNASADSTGVYVAAGHGEPPTVRRFDARGNELWTRQLDPLTGRRPVVAADELGVYILVTNGGNLYRYDQAGSETWRRQVWTTNSGGEPWVLAADSAGVFVAGLAWRGLPGQCYAGSGDAFLTRYTSGGNPTWTRQFGTAEIDNPVALAVDGSSVYALTYTQVTSRPGASYEASTSLARLEKESAPVTNSQPRILSECVLNSASYVGGAVAPGEIVTILGSAMGPADLVRLQVTPDGRVPTTLAGARILFDGEPAPLVYVSEKQSSAIVPYSVTGKATVDVQVEYRGVLSSAVKMPVVESRLGVFSFGASGSGQGAIVNEDGTVNSSFNPARRGSVVSIYGTGGGLPQPPGETDRITGNNPSPHKSLAYLRLASGGECDEFPGFEAEVLYYGSAPRSVPGLVQINARLPLDAPAGDAVPLFFGLPSYTRVEQVVTIAIR